MEPGWRRDCAEGYFGQVWAIDGVWLAEALSHIRSRTYVTPKAYWDDDEGEETALTYQVDESGIAVLELFGQSMKKKSKFGGYSTIEARKALRAAAQDPNVRAILLSIDSPGGTVGGTEELADEVRRTNGIKPVAAHGSDLVASAAYWIASQARRVSATKTTRIGSIGVLWVLYDESKALEAAGITSHIITTGPFKGAGSPEKPIPKEHLQYFQRLADDMAREFRAAVARGRGQKAATVEEWATGEVWLSREAKAKGLIDEIESIEDAAAWLRRESAPKPRNRRELAARELSARQDSEIVGLNSGESRG